MTSLAPSLFLISTKAFKLAIGKEFRLRSEKRAPGAGTEHSAGSQGSGACSERLAPRCALPVAPIVCGGGRAKPGEPAFERSCRHWRMGSGGGDKHVAECNPQGFECSTPKAFEEAVVPAAAAAALAANRRRVVATGNRASAERAARSPWKEGGKGKPLRLGGDAASATHRAFAPC